VFSKGLENFVSLSKGHVEVKQNRVDLLNSRLTDSIITVEGSDNGNTVRFQSIFECSRKIAIVFYMQYNGRRTVPRGIGSSYVIEMGMVNLVIIQDRISFEIDVKSFAT